MDLVLDLDLDFFVWPAAHWPSWEGRMPSDVYEHLSSEDDVHRFLSEQCHLATGHAIPSRFITTHDEAFDVWQQWISAGILSVPFKVIHADAHADLGLGESGWVYLVSEFLALPVDARSEPRRGVGAMNESNYLAFAVANRWISELVYVVPSEPLHIKTRREAARLAWYGGDFPFPPDAQTSPAEDLMPVHFHNCDPRTGLLELKRYATREDAIRAVGERDCHARVLSLEPQVPFSAVEASQFKQDGFTHLIVAHSPRYTPETADALLSVIRRFTSRV